MNCSGVTNSPPTHKIIDNSILNSKLLTNNLFTNDKLNHTSNLLQNNNNSQIINQTNINNSNQQISKNSNSHWVNEAISLLHLRDNSVSQERFVNDDLRNLSSRVKKMSPLPEIASKYVYEGIVFFNDTKFNFESCNLCF